VLVAHAALLRGPRSLFAFDTLLCLRLFI
jgi:hypothetical protein